MQGKEKDFEKYCGGAMFVDHASGYIFVKLQVMLNAAETVRAEAKFKKKWHKMVLVYLNIAMIMVCIVVKNSFKVCNHNK